MDALLHQTSQTFERFKSAFHSNDFQTASKLLSQLKISLTQLPALPPMYQQTPTAQNELLLAREILEFAVALSLKLEDEVMFERNFLQLKTYYTDTRNHLPPSAQEFPILGLNLLRLLVQNRIAEFHTELELLEPSKQKNSCILYTIQLEQSLMEGAYNRVLNSRQNVPDPSYLYFVNRLMETVRDEIAECCEKAYDYLTVADAKKMLMIADEMEFQEYISKHNFTLQNGKIVFKKSSEQLSQNDIPNMHLISLTLGYARELERIV